MGFDVVGEGGEIIDRWEIPDPSPNPEQLYLKRQTIQMLSNAVTRLPQNFRPIVEQFHGNDLKLTEAAQALGLKEGAAKSRLLRARALLRRRLQNQASSRT
jgi:DNA-directed RNA polymerase specialized sigma24 family protein